MAAQSKSPPSSGGGQKLGCPCPMQNLIGFMEQFDYGIGLKGSHCMEMDRWWHSSPLYIL